MGEAPHLPILLHFAAGPGLARRTADLAGEGLAVTIIPEGDDAAFVRALEPARVLWHVLSPVTARHIESAPELRLIQKIGVGVNTIDLEAARAVGIAVCNMPGTNSAAVAEMTLALMLAALRRLPWLDQGIRGDADHGLGGWAAGAAAQDSYGEIGGRSVGLVGYGAAPRRLAPVLHALGARVLYTATAPKPDAEPAQWRTLNDLLAEADIVSLHLPLDATTAGLIDARAIARMRPGAILVNTARGGLVDEPALAEALASGRLAAAALDVFAAEPTGPENPLLKLDTVIATPHLAWLTVETWTRSLAVAVENCHRLMRGEALLHRIV